MKLQGPSCYRSPEIFLYRSSRGPLDSLPRKLFDDGSVLGESIQNDPKYIFGVGGNETEEEDVIPHFRWNVSRHPHAELRTISVFGFELK